MDTPTYLTPPTISFEQAEPLLLNGDFVFYKARRSTGRLFDVCRTLFSDAPYVQVSILDIHESPDSHELQPCVMTIHEQGTQLVPLQTIVKERPVDIFRLIHHCHTRRWLADDRVIKRTFTIDFAYVQHRLSLYYAKKPFAGLSSWLSQRRSKDNDEALLRMITQAACIEAAFNDAGFDLCPRVSPNRATPARLSKSALLEHLFTIQ